MRNVMEGDFIETHEGLIFDVKGFCHPVGRITAYLRYHPSPEGERRRQCKRYKKIYELGERERFLEKHLPHYLHHDKSIGVVQSVPIKDIEKIYKPQEFLLSLKKKKMSNLEKNSLDFCALLSKKSGIPLSHFGISGSLLVGLAGKDSDIDVIVYGKKECLAVYSVLKSLRQKNIASPYAGEELENICHFRWGYVDERIKTLESQKLLHGFFLGKPYFIRLIRKPQRESFKQLGVFRVEGIVTDDRGGIFTPCIYSIESDKAFRLYSFRGRYCEHLRKGDKFSVRARIEEVNGRLKQVVLGGERVKIF